MERSDKFKSGWFLIPGTFWSHTLHIIWYEYAKLQALCLSVGSLLCISCYCAKNCAYLYQSWFYPPALSMVSDCRKQTSASSLAAVPRVLEMHVHKHAHKQLPIIYPGSLWRSMVDGILSKSIFVSAAWLIFHCFLVLSSCLRSVYLIW